MTVHRVAGTISAFMLLAAASAGVPAFAADPTLPANVPAGAADLANQITAGGPAGELVGTFAGTGQGMNNVVATPEKVLKYAGTYTLSINGQPIPVFCIQFKTDVNQDATVPYTSTSWATSKVEGLGKVTDIVTRHAKIGTPLSDARQETAAVQTAIWAETQDITLDATTVPTAVYLTRAKELVAGAQPVAEPNWRMQMTATATPVSATESNVVATVTGANGPLPDVPIKVATESKLDDIVTGVDGQASIKLPAPATGTEKVALAATYMVPPGTVLAPTTGQLVITGESATITRAATVDITAGATPTPTPTPTPTVTPTPNPTDPTPVPTATPTTPGSLPHTGSSVQPWMVWAAILAALSGVGVFVWSRFRPSSKH